MIHHAKSILLVSDAPLMTTELERIIEHAGFGVAGPVGSVTEALFRSLNQDIEAALLDTEIGGEPTNPVLDVLGFANLPFALVTQRSKPAIPSRHSHRMLVTWPFRPAEI